MEVFPATKEGARAFLAGKRVEGIGPAYALRLVESLGTGAPRALLDDSARAAGISGIGRARAEAAAASIRKLPWDVDFLVFLYSCGISEIYIDRILSKYRGLAQDKMVGDPYAAVGEVWRMHFQGADKIGHMLGISRDDPRRLRGALITAVNHYAEEGHLYATVPEAVSMAASLAGVEEGKVEAALPGLIESRRVVFSRNALYLPVFYHAETRAAHRLAEISRAPVAPIAAEDIPNAGSDGQPYTAQQKEAILKAVNSRIMVLTGGPGTGKTTVLKGIVDVFASQGEKVVLAAPTGKAVKRMEHLTGHEASTIHRLLGYREGQGYSRRHIEADVLIIDEGSMMEQVLFDHLLQAVSDRTRVIMVGDADQLPAIGAGDVLSQMIDSGEVPVSRLTENFRQDTAGHIAAAAHAINMGEVPAPGGNLIIVPQTGTKSIHDTVIDYMTQRLPAEKGISPLDIMVVTPQQIGPLGARQLNRDLQDALNPDGLPVRRGTAEFRLGDPVMQTANSSQRGIYNGETGRIVAADSQAQSVTVRYSGDRQTVYSGRELSELVLAYATTVHKLQGSEVRHMIMPVTMQHKPMLYRNLLYTGVSRASDLCVLIGEPEALRYAVGNYPDSSRHSHFASRLRQSYAALSAPVAIDPSPIPTDNQPNSQK